MKVELAAKKIEENRNKLEYIHLGFIENNSYPRLVPDPQLPYGVPDVDLSGETIVDNVKSNSWWHLLSQMLNRTYLPSWLREEIWEKLKPYTETIFKNSLIDFDSYYIELFVERYDPIKLLDIIPSHNVLLRKNIYEYCEDLIDTMFINYGLYLDVVNINTKTIQKFRQLPDYPDNYFNKLSDSLAKKLKNVRGYDLDDQFDKEFKQCTAKHDFFSLISLRSITEENLRLIMKENITSRVN